MFEKHIMVSVSSAIPESLWCSVYRETKSAAYSEEKDTFHIGMLESNSADGKWQKGEWFMASMHRQNPKKIPKKDSHPLRVAVFFVHGHNPQSIHIAGILTKH